MDKRLMKDNFNTLSLTFDEFCHIRNVITRAELETLLFDDKLYADVAQGKLCFNCRKVHFNLLTFTFGIQCSVCKQKVCRNCVTQIALPKEKLNDVPIHTFTPLTMPQSLMSLEKSYSLDTQSPLTPVMNDVLNDLTHDEQEFRRCSTPASSHNSSVINDGSAKPIDICTDCFFLLQQIRKKSRQRHVNRPIIPSKSSSFNRSHHSSSRSPSNYNLSSSSSTSSIAVLLAQKQQQQQYPHQCSFIPKSNSVQSNLKQAKSVQEISGINDSLQTLTTIGATGGTPKVSLSRRHLFLKLEPAYDGKITNIKTASNLYLHIAVKPSQTPPSHHLPIDPHSTDHVQQQHSTITANMSLAAERDAYLRLAAHSMENSRQIAPNFNVHSPKAYGGYVSPAPATHAGAYDQQRPNYVNGLSSPFDHAQQPTLSDTNLYIKNLPAEYSDKDLAALVEGCGKIKSMKAIIDKQTNKCKGFGFIDFESHEDAQNAIAELQKKGYTAQLAKSSQQQEQDETNLYFANLDLNMTEQDLRQALSEYGTVVSVRILRDQHKQSRGVGFARMNDRKQCQEIIDQFHNKTFRNFTDKPVQVKFADASKNKKLYKTGLDDMKSGPPLYSPMEQTGSYQHQTVIYSPWAQISPQQVPVHSQQAPQHPMFGPGGQLRQGLQGFNHPIPSYLQSSSENGAAFVLPLPVQQLQQLQIANGHPGYCVVNPPPHHAYYMSAAQPQSQPQHDQ
ncbi:unnamed protein product [Rotaria socialis]